MSYQKKLLIIIISQFFFINLSLADSEACKLCKDDSCKSKLFKEEGVEINWRKKIEGDWKGARNLFHEKINEKFNEKFAELTKDLQVGWSQYLVTNSAGIECKKEIEGKNKATILAYGTFADKILKESHIFQCALFTNLKSGRILGNNSETIITQDISQKHYLESAEIINEIEVVSKSISLTLEAFAEMQFAYIIHKKLECTIANLENMRDNLNGFVGQLIRIGGKFISSGFECR